MSRRAIVAVATVAAVTVAGFANDARAQETATAPRLTFVDSSALPTWQPLELATAPAAQLPVEVGQFQPPPLPPDVPIVQPYRRVETGTSPLLASLYATTALTQALDIHSTLKAVELGGVETNPMLAPIVRNKAAFIAVKSAVAAGSIYAAHKLAKRNKVAAIATLVAINTAYGFVAYHNYKVASSLR